MSTKHYFPSTAANTLVPRYLRALAAAYPDTVTVDLPNRVVSDPSHSHSCVTVLSGGGSGHEPAWSGYVGSNLLAAAACGDVFASPSTKQILAAMRAAPCASEDGGVLMLVTNYTGDRLHFGLAAERAMAEGLTRKCVVLPLTDDVSIGRSRNKGVGRRGMPGHVVLMKIVCGAAAEKYNLDRCVAIGRALNDQTVSIGSALDHCHVPGREGHKPISEDVCVLGAGIHNEPGAQHLSPFPSVENLIRRALVLLTDQSDQERGWVDFSNTDDRIALVINNYGGLSTLELGALTDEVQQQLESTYKIKPVRTLIGAFETSLNAPGFSISLVNLSAAARTSETPVDELLRLFDLPTSATSWPNTHKASAAAPAAQASTTQQSASDDAGVSGFLEKDDIRIDPAVLDKAIRTGCEAAIAAEPKLTQWDLIMGDGDCGEAVKQVCQDVLKILDAPSSPGSLLTFLTSTTAAVDDMGGTLGAILGILLSAFTSALRASPSSLKTSPGASLFAPALARACTALKAHTGAREGDRTVMDVLLPFAAAFDESKDLGSAVKVARGKADGTKNLKPKFGRATYVSESEAKAIPDPGAWALYEMLEGMAGGLGVDTK